MQRALQRHQDKQARVLPILLRPVSWERAPFKHLLVLPVDAKPITAWKNQDEAFVNVVAGISQAVETFARPDVPPFGTTRQVLKSDRGHTTLGSTNVTIGRAPDNLYVIKDEQVSGHHAVIRPYGPRYAIFDLKSSNRTFVNRQELLPETAQILKHGDTICVGTTTFTYTDGILVQPDPVPPLPVKPRPDPPNSGYPPVVPLPPQPQPPIVVPPQPWRHRNRGLWIVLVVIGVLVLSCSICSIIVAIFPSYGSLPKLVSSYHGTASPNEEPTWALDIFSLQESVDGGISGTVELWSSRSNTFNGSVKSDGSVHFTTGAFVTANGTSFFYIFDGQVSTNSSSGKSEMSGHFTSQLTNGGGSGPVSGSWNVTGS